MPTLAYTVMGIGGLSLPIPGFTRISTWWIDSTGNNGGGVLTSYGFDPVVPNQNMAPFALNDIVLGSLLLSSEFQVAQGQALTVKTLVLSPTTSCREEIDFVLLLKNSSLSAVLSVLRPDNINIFGDMGPMPSLTHTSPGVTTVVTPKVWNAGISLNGQRYGRPFHPGSLDKYLRVTSSCKPGQGSYQLAFGTYHSSRGPSAMIIGAVTLS